MIYSTNFLTDFSRQGAPALAYHKRHRWIQLAGLLVLTLLAQELTVGSCTAVRSRRHVLRRHLDVAHQQYHPHDGPLRLRKQQRNDDSPNARKVELVFGMGADMLGGVLLPGEWSANGTSPNKISSSFGYYTNGDVSLTNNIMSGRGNSRAESQSGVTVSNGGTPGGSFNPNASLTARPFTNRYVDPSAPPPEPRVGVQQPRANFPRIAVNGVFTDWMVSEEQLLPGGRIIHSKDNGTLFQLQMDGNLVLKCSNGSEIWSSGTRNKNVMEAVMRYDGNLVIVNENKGILWMSQVATGFAPENSGPRAELFVQNDNNVCIYHNTNLVGASWCTRTTHKCRTNTTANPQPTSTNIGSTARP